MDRYRIGFYILLGVVLGIACAPGKGPAALDSVGNAYASSTSDCSQWETRYQAEDEEIPAGWEPFAWAKCSAGYDCLALRKCTD